MDAFAIRARHAYPIYDLDYKQNIETVKGYLRGLQGLEIVGRGGAFQYNNADHSIEMGLILAQKLLGMEVDHTQVNADPEYHEIVTAKPVRRDAFRQAPEAELESVGS